MRDRFSVKTLVIPAWVLAGIAQYLWGPPGVTARVVWILVGLGIAYFAWRAAVDQEKEAQDIATNLGKLVSVTEPSPKNILAAAAAKILTLEHSQTQLAAQLDQIRAREWQRLTNAQKTDLAERLRKIGPHTVWIVRPQNLDCIALAADFDSVFREALWDVPASEPYSIEEQKRGITIHSLMGAVEEALRTAIIEATELPATIYRGSEIERKYRSEKIIVLSIGPNILALMLRFFLRRFRRLGVRPTRSGSTAMTFVTIASKSSPQRRASGIGFATPISGRSVHQEFP